jgi:hypothetical protein
VLGYHAEALKNKEASRNERPVELKVRDGAPQAILVHYYDRDQYCTVSAEPAYIQTR